MRTSTSSFRTHQESLMPRKGTCAARIAAEHEYRKLLCRLRQQPPIRLHIPEHCVHIGLLVFQIPAESLSLDTIYALVAGVSTPRYAPTMHSGSLILPCVISVGNMVEFIRHIHEATEWAKFAFGREVIVIQHPMGPRSIRYKLGLLPV